jgi:hypothetical protein
MLSPIDGNAVLCNLYVPNKQALAGYKRMLAGDLKVVND